MATRRLLGRLLPMSYWLLRIERAYSAKPLDVLLDELTPVRGMRRAKWRAAEEIRKTSDIVVHHLPRPNKLGNCLAQSLLRYQALRAEGFPVEFRLGLRKVDGEMTGHAWVSLNGTALWEDDDATSYRTTFRYPGDRSNAAHSSTG